MVRRAADRPGFADILILAVTVTVSLTLLFAGTGFRSAVARGLSRTIFLPFRLVLVHARCPADVMGEIRELREAAATRAISSAEFDEVQQENSRLRAMVGFAGRETHTLLPALVVGRSADRFGEILGIEPSEPYAARIGQAVVSIGGLVGVVIDAGARLCQVRTLRHDGQPVSAMLADSRSVGMLRWDASARVFRLEGLPMYCAVADSEAVITSGYGGVFPKGIPIGMVQAMREDSTTLVKEILVAPATDFDRVEEVFLLGDGYGN